MSRPLHAAGAGALPPGQLTIAWQSAALLLSSPDESLVDQLETIHRVSHHLPDSVGGPLRSTVVHLESVPLPEVQQEYAETFRSYGRPDLAHKGPVPGGPKSDELCAVLEYAATVDQHLGLKLLMDRRAGLERLRAALTAAGSGWSGAVTAVVNTLPDPNSAPSAAVPRLDRESLPG